MSVETYHDLTSVMVDMFSGIWDFISLARQTFEGGEGTSGNYCKQSMDRRNVLNVYY